MAPQPGVKEGQLTRCPVSGVVFAAAVDRPRVEIRGREYVVCCESCAGKLHRAPEKFLNL